MAFNHALNILVTNNGKDKNYSTIKWKKTYSIIKSSRIAEINGAINTTTNCIVGRISENN